MKSFHVDFALWEVGFENVKKSLSWGTLRKIT